MKRHFYTDPLAAAWMAKHIGMRFGFFDERSDFREYEVPITGEDDWWRSDRGRFYVHPDSLHLLEPRIGDLLVETGRLPIARIVDSDVDYISFGHNIAMLFATEMLRKGRARIIQRDGKPFFWPELED
ncbi:hypothetical protein J8F10_24270 [Gemmata sp. G18]|uniref:Uncharacterized protein n=1 Tax=Gemmata palustris TaxID=2822762 RepID=A0ABS5BY91_9BACT|nr:hypothetical protein [Gemmata palustris]MBP3958377.1 hypothetical protein [Gemmata palustris]